MVRTSRCGRNNLGSSYGVVNCKHVLVSKTNPITPFVCICLCVFVAGSGSLSHSSMPSARRNKSTQSKQARPQQTHTRHRTRTTDCRVRSLVSNLLGRARPEGYSAEPACRFQPQFRLRCSCAAVCVLMLSAKSVGMIRTYVYG